MPSAFAAVAAPNNPAAGAEANGGENYHASNTWRVKIDGKLVAEEAVTPLSITRSLGMRNVDQAIVVYERAASPNPFFGSSQIRPSECGKTLEIFDSATGAVKFWGIIEDADFYFGAQPDEKRLVATIQPHHFGEPITDCQYLNVTESKDNTPVTEVVKINNPIVFNGWADGDKQLAAPGGTAAFTGNMSRRLWKPLGPDNKPLPNETRLFIDLDAVQSPNGRKRYGAEYLALNRGSMWTLRDAVKYLCAVGNIRGLIGSPTDQDLSVLPDVLLYRTELPVGIMLTEALDRLLGQYGFYWYVDPNAGSPEQQGGNAFTAIPDAIASIFAGATKAAKPRIKFVARGLGPEVEATHAKPGSKADFESTNVHQFRARYSISPTVNEIVILGGRVYVEATLELQRVALNKWAFNEALDYDVLAVAPYRPSDDPNKDSLNAIKPDLAELFPPSLFGAMATTVPIKHLLRRRRFLPMLNLVDALAGRAGNQSDLRPAGPQYGVNIEIIERRQDDAKVPSQNSKVWINIAKHPQRHLMNVRLAEDELAIYFDDGHSEDTRQNDERETFLQTLGKDRRLRVTGVIESDVRLQLRVKRRNAQQAPSVQSRPVVFMWEDSDRFPCRRILTTGKYASKSGISNLTSQTPFADDVLQQMREFGEQLLAGADQATLSGQIEFMHLDYNVPLGGIVKQIAGRELHLITTDSKDTLRYPQIVSLHYDVQSQFVTATISAEPDNIFEAFG